MLPIHTGDRAQPVVQAVSSPVQARRRQLLGIVLIAVGSVWFWLRATGQIGDFPLPICWFDIPAVILHTFNVGCHGTFMSEGAYGMLTFATIHGAREYHAES
jgi:fatty acid desaturase